MIPDHMFGNPADGAPFGKRPGRIRLVRFTVLDRGFMVIAACLFGGVSCVKIPAYEQQDLSRPNMVFESQGAFASRPAIFGQTEPGSAGSTGGQAAGCTVCR